MALRWFPDSYKTLINNYAGTKKFVDATNGSDSNDGNTEATAYATLAYCQSQISGNTAAIMIVVNPGTYDLTPGNSTQGYVNSLIDDFGNERVYVCSPDARTVVSYTASQSVRDAPMVQLTNANSAIYGGVLKRNNNGRTGNYPVAFFRGNAGATYLNGLGLFNCVLQETNANGDWSLQYDNSGNAAMEVTNCTFYTIENGSNDYSGGAGLVLNNCAFNYTYGAGSATKTNTVVNQTIDANTYALSTDNTTYGVYSGTYAWGQALTGLSFQINGTDVISANEGDTVTVVIVGSTETGTRNYTISGVSSSDINGASLTGSVTLVNNQATLTIVLNEDISSNEGTETLTIVVEDPAGNLEASLTIYDSSAVLFVTPTAVVGDIITVRLNTSNTPEINGTEIPYTISGNYITAAVLNQPLTGNFVVSNNIAEFTITIPAIDSTTLTVTAYGETASCTISFTPDITVPIFESQYVVATEIAARPFSIDPLTGISIADSSASDDPEPGFKQIETISYQNYAVVNLITETNQARVGNDISIKVPLDGIPIMDSNSSPAIEPGSISLGTNSAIDYAFSTVVTSTTEDGGQLDLYVVQPLGLPLVKEYWI